MLAAERRLRIARVIQDETSVRVSELSKVLQVSEVTIRRDLQELEKEGIVKKTHGGAIVVGTMEAIHNFNLRREKFKKEKGRIAETAARFIKNDSTIILDGGSTITQIAQNMSTVKNVNVITNALNIALELAVNPEITVMVIGGLLRTTTLSVTGPEAAECLKHLNADIAFLAVQGISLEKGLTNTSISDLYFKRAVLKAANEIIVVADSSKFDKVEFSTIAPLSDVNRIITDDGVPESLVRKFRKKQIEVIVV